MLRDARRRPARRPRQPTAHQRVPLRGPAGVGDGADGARHTPTAPSSSGTPTCRTCVRSGRERPHDFVNVGSGGRPKDGDWRVCYADRRPADARRPALRRVRPRRLRLHERCVRDLAATPLITTFHAAAGGVQEGQVSMSERPLEPSGRQRQRSAGRRRRCHACDAGSAPRRPPSRRGALGAGSASRTWPGRRRRALTAVRSRHGSSPACRSGRAWAAASPSGRSSTTTGCRSPPGCAQDVLRPRRRALRAPRSSSSSTTPSRCCCCSRSSSSASASCARSSARNARGPCCAAAVRRRATSWPRAWASSRPSAAVPPCRCSSASSRPASRWA